MHPFIKNIDWTITPQDRMPVWICPKCGAEDAHDSWNVKHDVCRFCDYGHADAIKKLPHGHHA